MLTNIHRLLQPEKKGIKINYVCLYNAVEPSDHIRKQMSHLLIMKSLHNDIRSEPLRKCCGEPTRPKATHPNPPAPSCPLQQTTWRKIWMVLFKPSFSGVGRLELHPLHDEGAGFGKKKAERLMVRLNDCLSATSAPSESCPTGCTAFYLNTTVNNYTLASMCTHQWLSAIWLLAFQVSLPLFLPTATPLPPPTSNPLLFFPSTSSLLSFGKGAFKTFPQPGRDSTMRKLTPYL